MKSLNLGSISKNLALLVILAVLPALAILLYTGIEQRQRSMENAKKEIFLLTQAMAEVQQDITKSTRQVLSTLSLLSEIQTLNRKACNKIFRAVLNQNPGFLNIALTDLSGNVLASGKPIIVKSLGDRKHVREALKNKTYAVGEYILARVGSQAPAFAFAYPVIDNNKKLKALLTAAIKLAHFSRFHDVSNLPEKSFVALTDHKGIRLYYYPPKEDTNPVGKPIKASSWEMAKDAQKPDIFTGHGSDGVRRIFAFEQVRLKPGDTPYLYVWAGIPEAHILATTNAALVRNLLLFLLATLMALVFSWTIGKNTLIVPIKTLVSMTKKFAQGKLHVRSELPPISNELGTLTNAFHDMASALARSQSILYENEARFRLLLDSLDALIYVSDMNTYEILFVNKHGGKLFGDITGKICWQTLHKGQNGPCPFCTNKYLLDENGKPEEVYSWEFKNNETGQYLYIQDRAVYWIDGRIVRLSVATDISKRKLAETKLAEESERLSVTLRSIADGVITTDTQGRVVLLNKVAETMTGWVNEEAAGQPLDQVFRIIDGETTHPGMSPVEKVLSSGEIEALANNTVLVSKTGQERNIADSAAPIRNKDSQIIGVVLVFRDITEQLRMENELFKVKKLESIGVLAGGIAHDFNNILAAILGNINLALFDKDLKGKTKKLLSEAEKASLRAKDLTQQLLTFAKGGEPVKEASSLENIIKDSANFVLHGNKVACHYNIPEDLWLVDIDKGQMSQVIQNIVLNAGHAMPEGGMISITCENLPSVSKKILPYARQERFVKLCIQDKGIGIPANVIEKVFDPYFSTKHEGSGLGLSITQSVISKHNGHITVESSPGVGSTFTIYLPASKNTRSQNLLKLSEEDKTSSPSRILIMDDEEMVRNIAKKMLVRLGHEVVLSKDGEDALQAYRESMNSGKPFELVIMDLTIPGGMGGKEAAQQILTIDPNAKIIVSSGYSNDPIMANFKDHGFCSAIEKPYQLQRLSNVINQFLK